MKYTTANWVYGHFNTKLGIYQYGQERWLQSNLKSSQVSARVGKYLWRNAFYL